MSDFGLDDWPRPGCDSGPRKIRVHVMYLRAARKAGVPRGFIFSAQTIAKCDGWMCCVCGGPVLRRWTVGQLAEAPVLAFAVAWADGGRYDKANARLAHYGCGWFPDRTFAARLGRLLTRDLSVKAHAGRNDETCGRGHPLSGANLLKSSDGRRRCRVCRNDRESGGVIRGSGSSGP